MRALKSMLLILGLLGATSSSAAADAVADFFKGKTVTLVIGYSPGGGYDTNARVLARHYGKFIPGQPTVIVQNMPGAGSLVAANHIYSRAAADGTVLGMFSSQAAIEPLFGNKEANFDSTKFSWIGSMSQEVVFCGVWQTAGAPASFDELITKEVVFGTTAPAGITYQHPAIIKSVLGAKIRLIPGYPGTREITLAMQKGEVNGTCGLFTSSIKVQLNDEVASGTFKLVIQKGSKRSDAFGKIPSVYDYAKTAEQRAILDVHFKQLLLSRPLAGPPAIPADRLKALRDGLAATLKDTEFLAEAERSGLEIDYASSEEIVDLLTQYKNFSPDVFRQAAAAMGR